MSVDAVPAGRIVEKRDRIYALDAEGNEVCGARRPYGHDHWIVHITTRVSGDLHHVIATSADAARAHVKMIAELFASAHL